MSSSDLFDLKFKFFKISHSVVQCVLSFHQVFIALYRERDTQVSVKNFTLKISARPSVSKRYDRTPGDALNFKLGKRYGGWVLDVKLPMYVAVKETNQPSWVSTTQPNCVHAAIELSVFQPKKNTTNASKLD